MKLPVCVNIELPDVNGNANIAAAILDFHYTNVLQIINTYDGCTSVVLLNPNAAYKVLIPFESMYNIYSNQHKIDERFKDEVDEYLKDNYKAIKDYNKGRNGKTS